MRVSSSTAAPREPNSSSSRCKAPRVELLEKIHVWVITVTLWFRDADLSACSWLLSDTRWFTIFAVFFSPPPDIGMRVSVRKLRAVCQEQNLLEGGWRVWEWVETVIFSSVPEGSPSLYKALWAAQESLSSYEPQEQRQQAAAAAARCSHQGIIRSLLLRAQSSSWILSHSQVSDYETWHTFICSMYFSVLV